MKFRRYSIRDAYTPGVTKARLMHARKAIEKERESWALFPENVKHTTPEARIAAIDAGRVESVAERRDDIAHSWRRGRAELRAMPADKRAQVLEYWNSDACHTREAVGLLTAIHRAQRGDDLLQAVRDLDRVREMGALMRELSSVRVAGDLLTDFQISRK